jgi:hypothetical protein
MPKRYYLWALAFIVGLVVLLVDWLYYSSHPKYEIVEIMVDDQEYLAFKKKQKMR